MEATKKLNGKAVGKWLSNNAIIMMMLAITLIVGIMHPNFFSGTNMINLFKNVSIRYIIALGISGCLITTGNDLSAGRLAGFAACLACIFAQTEDYFQFLHVVLRTFIAPVVEIPENELSCAFHRIPDIHFTGIIADQQILPGGILGIEQHGARSFTAIVFHIKVPVIEQYPRSQRIERGKVVLARQCSGRNHAFPLPDFQTRLIAAAQ